LILASFLILGAIIASIALVTNLLAPASNANNAASTVDPPTRTNILLLGVDNIGKGATAKRSDAIAVVSLKGKDVRVLVLPRDLRIKFPDGKERKVNAAYAMGGPNKAREAIANYLGVPINYFVTIDYDGFAKLIDVVGGVEINVKERMIHDDNSQNLHINIAPGVQRFDGKLALQYVRYRDKSGGDLARIRRQQELISAVLQQMKFNSNQEFMSFIDKILKLNLISHNMSLYQINSLAQPLRGLSVSNLKIQTLGGRSEYNKAEGWYLNPDPLERERLVNKILKGVDQVTNDEVAVLTLNGSGKAGIARATSEYLRTEKFIADKSANADKLDYEKTLLIDIGANAEKIKRLKQALQIEAAVVKISEVKSLMDFLNTQGITGGGYDLILVIGKDFVLPTK
jgi:LCP family protein required for cell wall assembly